MNFYYWAGYNVSRILAKIFFRFRILHRERMLQSGPVILASNHQSYFDPPLVGNASDRAIYYLARRSLLNVPVLGWLLPKLNIIPVDNEGVDRSALKGIIRVLKRGEGALIFPEGERTFDGNLLPAQPGVGLIIARTLAPVVPVRIFGAHEALPRGGGFSFHPITVVVGEPIYFSEADLQPRENLYARLSQRVMDAIAAIKLE